MKKSLILLFSMLLLLIAVLCVLIPLFSKSKQEKVIVEEIAVVPVQVEPELKPKSSAKIPVPNDDLLSFIGKDHSSLLKAAADGDNAFINDFDRRLGTRISELGYDANVTMISHTPYGTEARINSFELKDGIVEADVNILIYQQELPLDTDEELTLYPTGLIITLNSENVAIYATDSLSAYRACSGSLLEQLQYAYNMRTLQNQTAEANRQAQIAQEQAEKAQQQALVAQQAALQAEQQVMRQAEQQELREEYDKYYNDYYRNGRYYRNGVVIYSNNYRPWPRPPKPHPPKPTTPAIPLQPSTPTTPSIKPITPSRPSRPSSEFKSGIVGAKRATFGDN